MQKVNNGSPITCSCGKILAVERNGRLYIICRRCKREIEIEVAKTESRGHEPRGH